ncbi:LON peptidase substrate-binding domain-containing protein [Brevundimonas sp. M20]|uniref:LON peptidase substrate-binding domain-containing protein n=1 Tax=Brevundimonas sp. M20 TaxID=2591463 RepID=UPI00114781C2|nr:LON peptidase substrate-binding domain-containing protein [Brevundimonas sp. M20]QDH71954.1 peptidase S16 [Brevundimonas sp. M20]
MAQGYIRAADLPQVIPVFPLSGVLLLPRGQLPLNIFEPRYLNMIDDAMAGDRIIGIIQPSGGSLQLPGLSPIGCAGRITSFNETSDGRYLITLTGVARYRIATELPVKTPYRQVRAAFDAWADDLIPPPPGEGALDRDGLLEALKAYLETRGLDIDWDMAETAPPEALVNSLSMALPFEPSEKQALLEAADLDRRAEVLTALMQIGAAAGDPGEGDGPSMQ